MSADDRRRIANAKTAYYRVMPIDAEHPDDRLWRSFRWGLTAEIILLDCRYERDQPNTDQYLSREQMDWLKHTLASSPCHFKVVANSVPITDMPLLFDFFAFDRWEGYRGARAELLEHINAKAIENVWFLSGDLHVNFVSRLNAAGDDLASRAREIAVTGGNTGLGVSGPNFDYSRAAARGCLVTFDPGQNLVQVTFIDPNTGAIDYQADLRRD
jgi:alkaline phosphatase D